VQIAVVRGRHAAAKTGAQSPVSQDLINALYIIPILGVLILIHEIGHFVAARLIGARVEEFGIGIPPRIKGWRYKGVIWSLNWIPFGGFVRVFGEDGKATDPASINSKSPLQRAFFLSAGSLMNFLLAFVLMIVVVGAQGVSQSYVYVTSVAVNSPAEAAGWEAGDRIVEVAGAPVTTLRDLTQRTHEFAGRPMSVVIDRGQAPIETSIVPRANPPAGEGAAGVGITEPFIADAIVASTVPGGATAAAGFQPEDRILTVNGRAVHDSYMLYFLLTTASGQSVPVVVARGGEQETLQLAVPTFDSGLTYPEGFAVVLQQVGLNARFNPQFEQVPLASAIPVGVAQAWEQAGLMLAGLRALLTGGASLDQFASPIGIAQATSEVLKDSPLPVWVSLARLTILLSLNLAVLNLLPIPALDGGRLLFVLIEVLRGGKKLEPEREGIVHFAGLVLLLGLMFIVMFLDIGRLLSGESFFR
jgi:regulator of sigma E protease